MHNVSRWKLHNSEYTKTTELYILNGWIVWRVSCISIKVFQEKVRHWLSILHMVMYMFQCYSLYSSHPLLPSIMSTSLFSMSVERKGFWEKYLSPLQASRDGERKLTLPKHFIMFQVLCWFFLYLLRAHSQPPLHSTPPPPYLPVTQITILHFVGKYIKDV